VIITIIFAVSTGRSYLTTHNTIKTQIEGLFSTIPFDTFFKESFNKYLNITQRGHFNGVTFLTDGRLMFDTQDERVFLNQRADEITRLNDYLHDYETPFLYIRIPNKLQDNSLLPLALSDNHIINDGDRLVNILDGNGVDTLDLRVEMERDDVDFYSAFYNGDHHWTTDTALWALKKIGEYANREYGFNIDGKVWDIQQYEHFTFKQAFLGEESEIVYALSNFEDISFLVPKFFTEHTVYEISDDGYTDFLISGSFADVFVPKVNNEYNDRIVYDDLNVMQWYRSFNRYITSGAGDNKNVLFIADSMGWPLGPLFANAFESVDNFYLVPRANQRVWAAIDRNDYDLVVFLLSDVVLAFEDSDIFDEDRLYLGYPEW